MSDGQYTDGTERREWQKAKDEVLDEMAQYDEYNWNHVQLAVEKMALRWSQESFDTGTDQNGGGHDE